MLGAIALAWCWYFHFWPQLHTANEAIRLDFVQAIVDEGTTQIDQIEKRHGQPSADRCRFEHHDYMDKAPGLSLLTVPIYALAKAIAPSVRRYDEIWKVGQLACLLTTALPLLLALRQLLMFLRRRGVGERDAALTVCALALASPLFVYATLFFGHGLATACVMFALFQWLERDDVKSRFIAGLWLGLAGLTDTPVFVLGAFICIYSTLGSEAAPDPPRVRLLTQVKRFVPISAAMAIFVGIQLVYNYVSLGHPLRFSYHYKADPRFAAIMATGVFGFGLPTPTALFELLFGSSRGLFTLRLSCSQVFVATLSLYLSRIYRGNANASRAFASPRSSATRCLSPVLRIGLPHDSPGARHLLPITPLLAHAACQRCSSDAYLNCSKPLWPPPSRSVC